MAQIIPFRGTMYDQAAVGAISDVVAPPYDIIDAAAQQALHDRHPQNIIRLELGIDHPGDDATSNRYTRAARKTLRGFLTTTKLEPLDSGQIYPHENTRSAAKTDRLNLLKACKANLSPIWLLYSDPQNAILGLLERAIKGHPSKIDFEDDNGCRQQLWPV